MAQKNCFPAECLEDIFRHLNKKVLVECSLVCPTWNDYIGSSRSCMKKISLTCRFRWDFSDTLTKILEKSNRNYFCLKFRGQRHEELQKFLSESGRSFTHLRTTNGLTFSTMEEYANFLRTFESYIQKLILTFGSVGEPKQPDFHFCDLQFPNLKTLDVYCRVVPPFVNCKTLENLSISLASETSLSELNSVKTILERNKGLKTLNFGFSWLFNRECCPDVRFKLEKLKFGLVVNEVQQINLNHLLKTQRETLEVLELSFSLPISAKVMKNILSLTKLKKLTLSAHPMYSLELPEAAATFQPNHSVTDFRLKIYEADIPSLEIFFKAFPKIETLMLQNVTIEAIEAIAKHCKFLKHLSFNYLGPRDTPKEALESALEKLDCCVKQTNKIIGCGSFI